tara:strand:- start:105 stop:491 length:387 start_codon:yes stop_codon:yes gene_type:complete
MLRETFKEYNDYYTFADLNLKAEITPFVSTLLHDDEFHHHHNHTNSYKSLFDQYVFDHDRICYTSVKRIPSRYYIISYNFYNYLKKRNFLVTYIMGNYVWGYEKSETLTPGCILDDYYLYLKELNQNA